MSDQTPGPASPAGTEPSIPGSDAEGTAPPTGSLPVTTVSPATQPSSTQPSSTQPSSTQPSSRGPSDAEPPTAAVPVTTVPPSVPAPAPAPGTSAVGAASTGATSTSGGGASPADVPGARAGTVPPKPPSKGQHDWPVVVAERIESVVGTVRDKTTVPVTRIARAVVFGLLAAVVGIVLLVLAIDVVVRLVDVYLPFHPRGRRVWVGDLVLGAIFLVAGAFCWSKRTRKPQETKQ